MGTRTWLVVIGWILTSCSDDAPSGGAKCVAGKVEACPCPGQATGSQTCLPSGTFGPCTCDPLDAGKDASIDAGVDAPIDANADVAPTTDAGSDAQDSGPLGPPSCVGLPTTCGPASDENCCKTLAVPGGTFNRGNDATYPATVSGFALEKFEVTVGRFRKFVEAGKGLKGSPPAAGSGAHPKIAGSGWDATWNQYLPDTSAVSNCGFGTWDTTPSSKENRPINCMNWYVAFAFCAWDGGRLPTEAEWNYAAAGGDQQRVYPWSNPPSSTSIDASYAVYGGTTGDDIKSVGSTSPKGDGRWGHADLAGNISEWVLDELVTYPLPCTDCAALGFSSKVRRGGAWVYAEQNLVTSYRYPGNPAGTDHDLGFRCARD